MTFLSRPSDDIFMYSFCIVIFIGNYVNISLQVSFKHNFQSANSLQKIVLLIFHQEFLNYGIMTSLLHHQGILKSISCFPLDMVVYFSDKTYTTVVFISLRMSEFIFGVCFSTFICFSFVFNKKFQHVQMLDIYPCCLYLL